METAEEKVIKLSCKNLDAYKAFLMRLSKISNQYARKNDTWIAVDKKESKSFGSNIPGKHMVLDPFIDLSKGAYVIPNECYYNHDITATITEFNEFNESYPALRKYANYAQNPQFDAMSFRRGDTNIDITVISSYTHIMEQLNRNVGLNGDLIKQFEQRKKTQISPTVATFDNFEGILKDQPEFEWEEFSTEELIHIRNYNPLDKFYHGVKVRFLKPLFLLAGTLRKGMPVANFAEYRITRFEDGDFYLGKLQIHAKYPCLSGSTLEIEAIHEYTVLGWLS